MFWLTITMLLKLEALLITWDRIALKLVPVDKLTIDRSDDQILVNRVDKTINPIDRPLTASSFGQCSSHDG